MRRSMARLFIVGVAMTLSGCITDDTIDLIAADPDFEPKAQIGAAEMPTFRVGDVFRYKVGDTLVAETVERIDGDGVWWRDSLGRRWVGSDGALIPTRAVARSAGKAQLIDAKIESTGNLFPLTVGKKVSFRSTKPNWLQGSTTPTTHSRTCKVENFGTLKIAAGSFDAFRLECH